MDHVTYIQKSVLALWSGSMLTVVQLPENGSDAIFRYAFLEYLLMWVKNTTKHQPGTTGAISARSQSWPKMAPEAK